MIDLRHVHLGTTGRDTHSRRAPVSITDDQKRCPCCGELIFPALSTTHFITAPEYECGHGLAWWQWVCDCGYLERHPLTRCPFCVGATPPEGEPHA